MLLHDKFSSRCMTPGMLILSCVLPPRPADPGLLPAQLRTITRRVNTVNNRLYADDPTIFAWELCNECQCASSC